MLLSYKYRLFTRKHEEASLDFILGQSRYVYNKALELRRDAYEKTQKSLSYAEQWAYFRDERRSDSDRLGKLNASCMQQTLRRLDKAFKAFFRRVKRGEKAGHPRFKGANRFRSLDFTYGDGCKLKDKHLYIQNVGEVKVKLHRPIPENANIKRLNIQRSNGKWYACFTLELPNAEPVNEITAIGIDAGLSHLLNLSDGQKIDNPKWFRQAQGKLRRQQRHLSRCTKGTNVRRKAAKLVAKTHERITNQRRDFWHKETKKLLECYDVVVIEDLTLNFMLKNKRLSKSAADAGIGIGFKILTSKAEKAGQRVIKVNPKNTSQECSRCGEIVKKSLSQRVHKCNACNLVLDRDTNAARNILRRGQRLVSATWDISSSVLAEAA